MKFKRFALKGLVILAVVVALCIFFSGTITNITTPKVKIVQPVRGRFEKKIPFESNVYFAEKENVTVSDASKTNITVDKVRVSPGMFVEEGDIIFTAKLPSFEEDMKKLDEEYNTKAAELLALDIENRKSSKASAMNERYDAMKEAQLRYSEQSYLVRVMALEQNIKLSEDVTNWQAEAAVGNATSELNKLIDQALAAKAAYDEASKTFLDTYEDKKLRLSDSVFKYINDRNAILAKLEEITEQKLALHQRNKDLAEIKAPHSGYIIEMKVSAGDTYDGSKEAYVISAPGTMPVLRALMTDDMSKGVDEGTQVTLSSQTEYGGDIKTNISHIETATDGTKYIHILLDENTIRQFSSVYRMMQQGSISGSITYKAKTASNLLPVSAVRQRGENDYYVYVIRYNYGGFLSNSSMIVEEMTVTVTDESETQRAIAEDLMGMQIADREDRPLENNKPVMGYEN